MNSDPSAEQSDSLLEPKRVVAGWKFWWRVGFGLVALLGVAALYDEAVSHALTNWPAHERWFFHVLTRLGEADWILYPALILALGGFLIRGLHLTYTQRWAALVTGGMGWYLFIGVAAPSLVATILKRLIGRARPVHLEELGTLAFQPFTLDWTFASFPSGHATTAFAFAVTLTALLGIRWRWLFFAFAALIALSRVVTGMHYLTDVVAGAALGTFGAILVRDWFAARRFPVELRRGVPAGRIAPPLRRFLWRRNRK